MEGRIYRRAKPIFYKCALRGYSFTILCFAKSFGQARHLCAQSAALMCLMGTPHTPLYARRTVRITGTSGGFPSPRSSTDATDHDALQPLRGSEADCVRSPIRQSIPSRPQHRSSGGRTAPEEMGRSPIFDKRGYSQRASPASLKDKRREEYHQTRMVKPFSLNSHRTIYAELPYKLYGNSA